MATNPLDSPVVVDGIVSEEKVADLIALQTEYPELDYKAKLDVTSTKGRVDLVAVIGSMGVRGGYILGGVDDNGRLTGLMDEVDLRAYDEASLRQMFQRFLPRSIQISTNVVERDGHKVVAICMRPHPDGCVYFEADGKYLDERGDEVVVFREDDVFWRDGTRTKRIDRRGHEEIVRRRVSIEKEQWMEEQQQIRRREREELQRSAEARDLAEAPLGAVNIGLAQDEIFHAALEMARKNDRVAILHLLNDARARVREQIAREDLDALRDTLDKLACLGSTFMEYEQEAWLDRVVHVLVDVYGLGFGDHDPRFFGYAANISSAAVGPQVWLAIVERVYGIGALAVRHDRWHAVRMLTLQLPRVLVEDDYEKNWLRHAVTMASRAQHLREEASQNISLLSLARADVSRLRCLRLDGVGADDDEILSSLAQFDVLANLVAIGATKSVSSEVFYTNFARFRQTRIQQIVERLLVDPLMRQVLFPLPDEDLANALNEIGERAAREGWMSDGFEGWGGTRVGEFIEEHLSAQ